MIRSAAALAVVLTLGAGAVHAQTVEVLTGEHGEFTRLAMVLPPGSAWALEEAGKGYALRLDRVGLLLDSSRAFNRIDRTRIASIDPIDGGAGIQINLNCACEVVAFEDRPGILVIDVRAGPPLPGRDQSMAEVASPVRVTPPPANPRQMLRLIAPALSAPAMDQALPRFSTDTSPRLEGLLDDLARAAPTEPPAAAAFGLAVQSAPTELAPPPPPEAPATLPPPPNSSDLAGLFEAEEALLRQVARAAAQGLVDPRTPQRDGTMAGAAAEGNTAKFEDHMAVNAQTGLDRELGLMAETLRAGGGRRCLAEDDWAVASWGDLRPPSVQIAEARSRLIGEFDRPDRDAVLRLARLYLHFGFGAEAAEVLRAFLPDLPQAGLLNALAEIMDEGAAPLATSLHALTQCENGAALWAVLARPTLTPADPISRDKILRDFAILPPHLRQHLGPPLSERFMGAGDAQAARMIRDAILRTDAPQTSSVALLDARVDLAGGARPEAEAQLRTVAAGTSPDAAEALALLIEDRLARGEPVDAATATHAEAMAFERAGSPVADRLAKGHARALASLGDFDAAMAAFARLGRDAQDQVLPDLLTALTRSAPDTTFLIHVFALRDRLDIALPPAQRLTLSDRLLTLGFPSESRLLLAAVTPGPEAALQRARAAILRVEPRAALREIAGRTDPDAEAVRASALLQLDQPLQAAEAWLAAGQQDRAATAAWRAGDLAMSAQLSEPERGTAIMALAVPRVAEPRDDEGAERIEATEGVDVTAAAEALEGQEPVTTGGPLTEARAQLEQSKQTRAAIDALLATFPAP